MSLPSSPSQPDDLVFASLRYMMTSVLAALPIDPQATEEDQEVQRQAAVAILGTLHPTDAVQHMFAARTAAAHFAILECFRRCTTPDQSEQVASRLLKLADVMDRMAIRSMDRLKRLQSDPLDRAHPAKTEVAAAEAQHDSRDNPMPSENLDRTVQPAAQQDRVDPVKPPLPASAHTSQSENRGNNPMSSEPDANRSEWIAMMSSLSPEEHAELASSMQVIREVAGLPPIRAALSVSDTPLGR